MFYSREQQAKIVYDNIDEAVHRLREYVDDLSSLSKQDIIDRMMDSGLSVYGDKSFHKSTVSLMNEIKEELMDAVVYESIIVWIESGGRETE